MMLKKPQLPVGLDDSFHSHGFRDEAEYCRIDIDLAKEVAKGGCEMGKPIDWNIRAGA